MALCDSDKFKFVEMDIQGEESGYTSGKYLIPVHYRNLGEKDGHLYSKKVSWSDVVINGVPLEKSFEYEDQILDVIAEKKSFGDPGIIIVNERRGSSENSNDVCDSSVSDDYRTEQKRWINRLKRLGLVPFNYREAKKKKKKSQGKYPVKPKHKRILHSQKQKEFLDDAELKEEELEELKDCVTMIRTNEYEDATIYIDETVENTGGWGPGVTWFKKRIMKNYCPPLHWIKPVVRWDLIWSEMDTIEYGKKRDFTTYPPMNKMRMGNQDQLYIYMIKTQMISITILIGKQIIFLVHQKI